MEANACGSSFQTMQLCFSLVTLSQNGPVSWAVEYIDCISAEQYDSWNESPEYDAKQFDGQAPIMLELLGIWSTPS